MSMNLNFYIPIYKVCIRHSLVIESSLALREIDPCGVGIQVD